MATSYPLSAPAPELVGEAASAAPADIAQDGALVPSPREFVQEPITLSPPVARLPVELDVSIPVRQFRVRNLLALEPGQVVESQWGQGEDVPLAAGDVQLAWSEFDVVETQLAVRVTRLA